MTHICANSSGLIGSWSSHSNSEISSFAEDCRRPDRSWSVLFLLDFGAARLAGEHPVLVVLGVWGAKIESFCWDESVGGSGRGDATMLVFLVLWPVRFSYCFDRVVGLAYDLSHLR